MSKDLAHNSDIAIPAELRDHPVAKETDWGPLVPGGASFMTHQLEKVSGDRLVFASTISARFLAAVFGMIGMVVLIIGAYFAFEKGESFPGLIMVPLGAIFAGVGAYLYKSFDKEIIFDKSERLYWKYNHPNHSGKPSNSPMSGGA